MSDLLKREKLKSLLDKVLSQNGILRKGGEEVMYFCFECLHYKRKLEIAIDGPNFGSYHCWVCNSRGRSISSLFYKLKAKEQYFDELYKIIGKGWKKSEEITKCQSYSLPDEFIPLWNKPKTLDYGIAMAYLQDRCVSMDDIIRYSIGYCEEGKYQKRVLIPSYDKDGNLNFFAARAYVESFYKYMLPPWPKTIIGFELFVNWNEPITIVESPFNAITIRNNAIPLFGKTTPNILLKSIIENKVKRVNVCLDMDAEMDSVILCEKLLGYEIPTYYVELTKKDPNEIGFEKMTELINDAKKVDFPFLVRKKLNFV